MSRKKGKSKNKIERPELKQSALATFQRYSNEAMNYKQAAKKMGVNDDATRRLIPALLEEMKTENLIEGASRGRYRLSYDTGCVTGKVDMTAHGYAFIISSESEDDVFVSQKNLRNRCTAIR